MSDIVGSAIQGISNIGSTLFGINSAKKQQQREQAFNAEQAQINRDFQREEREAVQEYELDMWNRNNEYNSLASQLDRVREAGVSPNSILGGSYKPFQSTQLTSTPMSGATASAPGSIAPSMLNAYASLGTNTAGIINTLAQADNTKIDTKYQKATFDQRVELLKQSYDLHSAEIKSILSKADLDDVSKQQIEQSMEWIAKFNPVQLDTMLAELNNTRVEYEERLANIRETDSRTSLNEQLENESVARVASINEDTYAKKAENLYAEENAYNNAVSNEVKALEDKLRYNFSRVTTIPFGTSEMEFLFSLYQKGQLENYLNNVYRPAIQSTWTNEQRYGFFRALGRDIGGAVGNLLNRRGKVVRKSVKR